MSGTRIESARIKGFRSLADVELSGLGGATVMIGANGSGKSAPGKRIAGVMRQYGRRGYSKIRDGFLITGETGLDVICREPLRPAVSMMMGG